MSLNNKFLFLTSGIFKNTHALNTTTQIAPPANSPQALPKKKAPRAPLPGRKPTPKQRWIKRFKKYHKWPGIVITFFVLLTSVSGIIMNHRDWFSQTDISRHLLPPGYQYKNWNLAAIKGAVHISPTDFVVYGNIGAWLTNSDLSSFTDFNAGFKKGIDNRKIESMLYTSKGELLAGTLFGLYQYNGNEWETIQLPQNKLRITDITEVDGKVYVLSRSHLYTTTDLTTFETIRLPAGADYDDRVSLFKTLWTLHSGELFGHWGKIVVDLMALALIILSITGLFHWLAPTWIKKRKRKNKPTAPIAHAMKTNLKWHNKPGYILIPFLIITTITGMFLRPPLLIPIAGAKTAKIPYTTLNDPNPWFDKLRRITYDRQRDAFLLSTSEGFYYFDKAFKETAQPAGNQPPVSVMGCTVLETINSAPTTYMVGSFTGLFLWQPATGQIINALTHHPWQKPQRVTSPISDHLISGYFKTAQGSYLIDYQHGMQQLSGKGNMPPMPEGIIESSPMSLWNVALEVHTGRIFQHLTGPFYILYVPLLGIVLLLVLVSGFFVWWLRKKRNPEKNLHIRK